MRIGTASDYGQLSLRDELMYQLCTAGQKIFDWGTYGQNPNDDGRDFVIPPAEPVAERHVEHGIRPVRAAAINDHFLVRMGVEGDHINIVCVGDREVQGEVR